MDTHCVPHHVVLRGLAASCTMDSILHAHPEDDVLPDVAAREFKTSSWTYAQCQNAVGAYFNRAMKAMVFDVTIKTHYTLHCAQRSHHLNPRKGWNFIGEDFMAKIKKLLSSCTSRNTMPGSVLALMGKYRAAIHFQFMELDRAG